MKLGILTHPLYGNYGGMLQAYALVKYLRECGHDAYNLSYEPRSYRKILHNPFKRAKERFRSFLLKLHPALCRFKMPQLLQIELGQDFERKYVPHLSLGNTPTTQLEEYGIEAIVVGSDQVWRGESAKAMKSFPYFFLDFAPEKIRNASISYAASFGKDTWEGTDEEARICGKLLHDFRAVSVRETSAISMCKQLFDIEACRVADPTLLLHTEDYNLLIDAETTWSPEENYIATYILDAAPAITKTISAVATDSKLAIQPLRATTQAHKSRDRFPISVAQWLKLIRDSEYLVTDSFHGCVFAIIFNKPFVCLGNKGRGATRFESLLSTYGLRHRIVSNISHDSIQQVLETPIDWEYVNKVHCQERKAANQFIRSNLLQHV